MFKKLLRNKKAQQTAEYALLIALVVAAVIAMQTYAQRAIQARIKAATDHMVENDGLESSLNQYEPYYLDSEYDVGKVDQTTDIHTNATIRREIDSARNRAAGGYQQSGFNAQRWGAGDFD